MNYLEVVIEGIAQPNNRQYLNSYFYREFKKAEKTEFFEPDEFFNGCLMVIDYWIEDIKRQVWERKKELYNMRSMAKAGQLTYDNLEGKTIEEKREDTIKYCNEWLDNETPDGFNGVTYYCNLFQISKYRISHVSYTELMDIKFAISKAMNKANNPDKPKKEPKQTEGKKGRPSAKYKPIESYLTENPAYKNINEIAAILKNQYSGKKAADLKTMVEALTNLNIWKKTNETEVYLMLKTDFNYKESDKNYFAAKNVNSDAFKMQIQKLITK